jgi:hypothetical protein
MHQQLLMSTNIPEHHTVPRLITATALTYQTKQNQKTKQNKTNTRHASHFVAYVIKSTNRHIPQSTKQQNIVAATVIVGQFFKYAINWIQQFPVGHSLKRKRSHTCFK